MPALRSPLGSQSGLLDSVQMDTGDFTPAVNTRKRKKAGTPPPASGLRLIDRIAKETDKIRTDMGAALLHVKAGSLKELAACFVTIISDNVLGGFEAQANALSDLAGTMTDMTKTITDLREENEELKEELNSVWLLRETQASKDSTRDMEAAVREAVTKVKVMDLDFGACLNDRRHLIETANAALREKVRTDLRARFDSLMARASLAVIARATTKRAYPSGEEMWTAPVLVTIQDRESRWEAEDILRKSNCHPSFHWPKEMLEPVKVLRKAIVDSGVDDKTNYIRIRPDDRDGRMRIKADVKPKEGQAKFAPKATWAVPAFDPALRTGDWAVPVMVGGKGSQAPPPTAGGAAAGL